MHAKYNNTACIEFLNIVLDPLCTVLSDTAMIGSNIEIRFINLKISASFSLLAN